ncbi:MAG TPA: cytochrome c peroxidase [Candidatus Polarisedimenticolaceae bacterium]
MRWGACAWFHRAAVVALTTAISAAPVLEGDRSTSSRAGSAPSLPDLPSFELGRRTFHAETFGGNGRTCATCHEPRSEFALAPSTVRARFAHDPGSPLFRPKDSDDGDGRSYRNLLDHALIRVGLRLHPSVTDLDDPSRRTIDVWRGVPSITNVRFTAPYQHDGRIPTLEQQATSAIHDHMDPTREPTKEEIASLAEFQRQIFEPASIRTIRDFDPALPREAGYTLRLSSPAAVRGRGVFDRDCARCHDGEVKHRPTVSHDPLIVSVSVSEANRLGLRVHRLQFRRRDGTTVVVATPDPGIAATTGIVETVNAFEIPQLRGIKNTAPYFHDNSAETLEQVVDHYVEFLPDIRITEEEKADLLAFLETL